MRYRIQVKFVGFATIEVNASDEGAAGERAIDVFCNRIKTTADMDGKYMETTTLWSEAEDTKPKRHTR